MLKYETDDFADPDADLVASRNLMAEDTNRSLLARIRATIKARKLRKRLPPIPTTIVLACLIGLLGGYGAVVFTFLIGLFTRMSVEPVMHLCVQNRVWFIVLCCVPAAGLLAVSWLTRRFAPEAEGHGVPEVILAVARKDGIIRPRVAFVKILASGLCIGTGGSVGREGPIVRRGERREIRRGTRAGPSGAAGSQIDAGRTVVAVTVSVT